MIGSLVIGLITLGQLCHLCWGVTVTSQKIKAYYTTPNEINIISNQTANSGIVCASFYKTQAKATDFFQFDKESKSCIIGTVNNAALDETASAGHIKIMMEGTKIFFIQNT